MIVVNKVGRIVRLTKRPNPKNAINRYCHVHPQEAMINKTSAVYMFTYSQENE